MEKKEYLNEEEYQKNKKKISKGALIVLIIGLLLGGSLITLGIINNSKVDSSEDKTALTTKLNVEKEKLETRKSELKAKGFEYDAFARYDEGENYELKVITQALDPSFNYCKFDECKNNNATSNYCSLKSQLEDFDSNFNTSFTFAKSIPLFMIGGFIIIASCMIAGSIYMIAKRREILAFTAQQVMPVVQEGMEKMAPTVGNVAGTIGKDIAKGITSGIKEGLKDEEK